MHPHTIHCYVILVHYGDPTITLTALTALQHGVRKPDHTIVVDHAQTPLRLDTPHTHIIRPHHNAGYAAGLNIGLGNIFTSRPESHDIIICMNNDVIVAPTSIQGVIDYLGQQTRPTLMGWRWGSINPWTGRAQLVPPSERRRRASLTYLDGSFFAAPWSVFWQLKKIPDEYFMYWEESALAVRLRNLQIASAVVPGLELQHDDDNPADHSPLHTYYLVRNGAHFMQTNTAWPLRDWWFIYNRLRYLYHAAVHPHAPLVRRALRDAMKARLGPAKLPSALV